MLKFSGKEEQETVRLHQSKRYCRRRLLRLQTIAHSPAKSYLPLRNSVLKKKGTAVFFIASTSLILFSIK